jgi:hypothetical protein
MSLRPRFITLACVAGSVAFVGFAAVDAGHVSAAPYPAVASAPPCGAWGEIDDHPRPGIQAAANEVAARYQEHPHNDYFTAVGVCAADTLTVWRIPGSAEFDAEMTAVARRQSVGLRLVDSKYSAETLLQTINDIRHKGPNGLHIAFMTDQPQDGGYVEVGVNEAAEMGRRALAEYGDKVRVEGGAFMDLL